MLLWKPCSHSWKLSSCQKSCQKKTGLTCKSLTQDSKKSSVIAMAKIALICWCMLLFSVFLCVCIQSGLRCWNMGGEPTVPKMLHRENPRALLGPHFYLEGDENLKHKAVSGFEAVHYTSWNNFSLTFTNFVFWKIGKVGNCHGKNSPGLFMHVVVQCVFMCLHSIGSQMLEHGRRAEGSQDVA